jgi:hypothetical protein
VSVDAHSRSVVFFDCNPVCKGQRRASSGFDDVGCVFGVDGFESHFVSFGLVFVADYASIIHTESAMSTYLETFFQPDGSVPVSYSSFSSGPVVPHS